MNVLPYKYVDNYVKFSCFFFFQEKEDQLRERKAKISKIIHARSTSCGELT